MQDLKNLFNCEVHSLPDKYFCIQIECDSKKREACASCFADINGTHYKHKSVDIKILKEKLNQIHQRIINIANDDQTETKNLLQSIKNKILFIFQQARLSLNEQINIIENSWNQSYDQFSQSLNRVERIINENLINFDPKSIYALVNLPEGINMIHKILEYRPDQVIEDLKIKLISENHKRNIMKGIADLEGKLNKFQEDVLCSYIYQPSQDFFLPFEVDTFKCRLQGLFQGHEDRIWNILPLDNNFFASSSNDQSIKIWSFMEKKCVATLTGHTAGIIPLIKINQEIICSGSHDGTIRLWDWKSEQCLSVQKQHQGLVKCLSLYKENLIISGGEDKRIVFWDWKKLQIIKEIKNAHKGKVCSILPMRQSNMVTTGEDKFVKLWNINNYQIVKQVQLKEDEAECIVDLDYNCFATGSYKTITIWSIPNLVQEKVIQGHSSWILKLVKIDQHIIASASQDYSAKIWNWRQAECIKELKEGHNEKVFTLTKFGDFSILTGCKDGRIYQWI